MNTPVQEATEVNSQRCTLRARDRETRRQRLTCKRASRDGKHLPPLQVNVQFLEGKLHATSLGSTIFPDDWHWDLRVARREPIAHCTCAVKRHSLAWARQQTAAPKSQQKSGQSHVSQPASSVVQPRVFLGVLGIAEAPAMQERMPWMLEGEPEPWHTSHR